jgi:hypothetical protein
MKPFIMILVGSGILVFLALHIIWYIKPSHIASTEELNTHLTDGQPTVIEFYSNL